MINLREGSIELLRSLSGFDDPGYELDFVKLNG